MFQKVNCKREKTKSLAVIIIEEKILTNENITRKEEEKVSFKKEDDKVFF